MYHWQLVSENEHHHFWAGPLTT